MALNPQLKDILDMLNSVEVSDLESVSPAEMRAMFDLPMEGEPEPVGRVEDRQVPGADGPLNARIYRPEGKGPFPLMAFFHGGGFVLCDLETHDGLCRALCNAVGCVVVSVDYRLAPEARFPAAPEDCFSATQWCADHASELDGDPERLIVAGDSAGGCLAAVVAQIARDRRGPKIAHQLLMYPVTDRNFERESYLKYGEGYFLTREMMQWFWKHYLADEADAQNPYAAPLQSQELANLPPATVITGGYDPLKDEGKAYADKLAAAGVDVSYRCFEDMIHGFLSLPIPFEDGAGAVEEVAGIVKNALMSR